MSNGLSFREKLAQPAATSVGDRGRSSFLAEVKVELTRNFTVPVQLARILHEQGLSLAEAHAAVSELANKRAVTLRLKEEGLGRTIERIGALGLVANALQAS